jgi:hypothetical protein
MQLLAPIYTKFFMLSFFLSFFTTLYSPVYCDWLYPVPGLLYTCFDTFPYLFRTCFVYVPYMSRSFKDTGHIRSTCK